MEREKEYHFIIARSFAGGGVVGANSISVRTTEEHAGSNPVANQLIAAAEQWSFLLYGTSSAALLYHDNKP